MVENQEDIQVDIQDRLIDLVDRFSTKEQKKKKIDILERVVERTLGFQDDCDVCQFNISLLHEIITKIDNNDVSYKKDIATIKNHLLKKHKLLEEGFYMAVFMSIGVAVGSAFGTLTDNLSVFIGIGIALGVAIGAGMDADAKKKDKVL